jgi:hypothetical protein
MALVAVDLPQLSAKKALPSDSANLYRDRLMVCSAWQLRKGTTQQGSPASIVEIRLTNDPHLSNQLRLEPLCQSL